MTAEFENIRRSVTVLNSKKSHSSKRELNES